MGFDDIPVNVTAPLLNVAQMASILENVGNLGWKDSCTDVGTKAPLLLRCTGKTFR